MERRNTEPAVPDRMGGAAFGRRADDSQSHPRAPGILILDPTTLEVVEAHLAAALRRTGAASISLVERMGAVVANAGDPPLHPDQMGPLAAGLLGAMDALTKAVRAEEFDVTLPSHHLGLHLRRVDQRLFLCAFFAGDIDQAALRLALANLAAESRRLIDDSSATAPKIELGSFIEDKLNEIFSDFGVGGQRPA